MIGNKDDINDAVASAKKAQKAWAQVGARQRGQIISQCGAVSEKDDANRRQYVNRSTE